MAEESEEWKIFWERLQAEMPLGRAFLNRVFNIANEKWRKIAPIPGTQNVQVSVHESYNFMATMPTVILISAIGEATFEMVNYLGEHYVEKKVREEFEEKLKKKFGEGYIEIPKATPEECAKCGFDNPPTAKYCMECGESLEEENKNGGIDI